ncbi:Metallo-dependent phosphatase-like protein [Lipomyces mesembrius]
MFQWLVRNEEILNIVQMNARGFQDDSAGRYGDWKLTTVTPVIQNPTVYYGEDVWDLSSAAMGISITYSSSLTWTNHVKITIGLKPDTTYYYIVSNTNCYNCSELAPYTFTTARVAGDFTPYTAAIVIDMGVMGPYGNPSRVTIRPSLPTIAIRCSRLPVMLMATIFYGIVSNKIPTGDIAYADTWLREQVDGYLNVSIADSYKIYNFLLNQQSRVQLRRGRVTTGNTTYNLSLCVEGQRNFTGYINHYRMPSQESGGVGNFWYSFDHGMVHYVSINTETDLGNGLIGEDDFNGLEHMDSGPFGSYSNEQIDWLEKDLASVIVSGHRPWYAAANNVSICWNCKIAFEPLLLKYNVDMVFYGHIHMYERNAPIADGVPDPNELNNPSAPWYILNGLGGHYHGTSQYVEPFPLYVRYIQNTTYGWSKLTFHNCTHLTHEFISSSNGSVPDSATLFKARQCAASTIPSTSSSNGTLPSADKNAAGAMHVSSAFLITMSVIVVMMSL